MFYLKKTSTSQLSVLEEEVALVLPARMVAIRLVVTVGLEPRTLLRAHRSLAPEEEVAQGLAQKEPVVTVEAMEALEPTQRKQPQPQPTLALVGVELRYRESVATVARESSL